MASPKPLFTIPIAPIGSQPAGSVVCTEPAPRVYLLTMTIPADNRLTVHSCQALLDALDVLEFSYPSGAVVTTSGIAKFYSNGLDLELAIENPDFLPKSLYRLFTRLITYPMPTVALVNGHAFAGGFMLAMHHDYRVMNGDRGFLCVNELDFGVPLKPAMSAIFRLKLDARTYRTAALEAHRFSGREALERGVVDGLGGLEEVLRLVEERKLTERGKTGIYGVMKREMYRETVDNYLSEEGHRRENERDLELQGRVEDERRDKGEARVRELTDKGVIAARGLVERVAPKAKL